jgi:hypothetical protein
VCFRQDLQQTHARNQNSPDIQAVQHNPSDRVIVRVKNTKEGMNVELEPNALQLLVPGAYIMRRISGKYLFIYYVSKAPISH